MPRPARSLPAGIYQTLHAVRGRDRERVFEYLRFRAYTRLDGLAVHLGWFRDLVEAAAALRHFERAVEAATDLAYLRRVGEGSGPEARRLARTLDGVRPYLPPAGLRAVRRAARRA
jgi:hypothetical protein